MVDFNDNGNINSNEKQTSWKKVLEFALQAIPGCDLRAIDRIAVFLSSYHLRPNRLARLKEAVRVAASKMTEEASLTTGEQTINFQVLVSTAVAELYPQSIEKSFEANQVGWGFFLVKISDGAQSGFEPGESSYLLRLYVYVEGDQIADLP